MSAPRRTEPAADYAAISLKRLHDAQFWKNTEKEWLPRRGSFELQVGPFLGFSRVWREVIFEVESGPEFLYRYFPFIAYFYVNGRAQAVLEFDEPVERLRAKLRVPIGVPVNVTIVTELAHAPYLSGHGADERELALRFFGVSLGEALTEPPSFARENPPEHYAMRVASADHPLPAPIFVVGAYRSGTSVLAWALGQHPNIWPLEETGWIPPLADAAILGYRNAKTAARSFFDVYDVARDEYYLQIALAIDGFCRNASRKYLHGVLLGRLSGRDEEYNAGYQLARSVMNPKRRWVDGTPENTGYILQLRAIFPLARFIGMIRNPLDAVASMLRFDRAGGETRTVSQAADLWLANTGALLLAYRAFGPQVVRLMSYEHLSSDPQAALRTLFDFIEEPEYSKAVETFSTRINSSKLSTDEREVLHAEIAAEPAIKRRMTDLYRELLSAAQTKWEPNDSALTELIDIENDRIGRMALEYRGGVPLPSE